jgi:hypothetical protein
MRLTSASETSLARVPDYWRGGEDLDPETRKRLAGRQLETMGLSLLVFLVVILLWSWLR